MQLHNRTHARMREVYRAKTYLTRKVLPLQYRIRIQIMAAGFEWNFKVEQE